MIESEASVWAEEQGVGPAVRALFAPWAAFTPCSCAPQDLGQARRPLHARAPFRCAHVVPPIQSTQSKGHKLFRADTRQDGLSVGLSVRIFYF